MRFYPLLVYLFAWETRELSLKDQLFFLKFLFICVGVYLHECIMWVLGT